MPMPTAKPQARLKIEPLNLSNSVIMPPGN